MAKSIEKFENGLLELDLSKIIGGNTFFGEFSMGLDGVDCSKKTTRSRTATDCIGGTKEDTTTDNVLCPGSFNF